MGNKNSKGITLIVLVITIIILLILAGATIAFLTGENGILNKSTKAKNETQKQTATEIINLKITNVQIENYSEKQQMPTLKELSLALKEDEEIQYITESSKVASVEYGVTSDNPSKIYIKLKEYPYEFEINENLKLATIDGEIVNNKDDNTNSGDNTNNDTNNNDEIKNKLEELEIAVKAIQSQNEKLKTENTDIKNRMHILENETILNKRIKLITSPVNIALETTAWKDGDFANITLSDSIKNYKYLEIQYNFDYTENINNFQKTKLIATEQLLHYNNSNTLSSNNESSFPVAAAMHQSELDFGIWCWFKTDKILHVGATWSFDNRCKAIKIHNIYGIK